MKIYEYSPMNEIDCLAIFDSNVPAFFAAQEREKFRGFLNRLASPYYYFFVCDANEQIVACGGMKFEPSNHLAMLRWDMVTKKSHHQNIGKFLTLARLHIISQDPDIQMTNLHTSQHSYQFYEKLGFVVQQITPDGIVDGMDEYYMELKFSKEKIQELEHFAKQRSLQL